MNIAARFVNFNATVIICAFSHKALGDNEAGRSAILKKS
jgi:hypothetical protein